MPPSGPKVMIAAGFTESTIAAIADRSLPSASNDASPPSSSPTMCSCFTPSRFAAQLASLARAAASCAPAGILA